MRGEGDPQKRKKIKNKNKEMKSNKIANPRPWIQWLAECRPKMSRQGGFLDEHVLLEVVALSSEISGLITRQANVCHSVGKIYLSC